MTESFPLLVAGALGYLLGALPFGLLLTRAAGLGDIRAIGSGNIGATNVLRTGRRGLAAATLVLDGAKGAAAVLLARYLGGTDGCVLAGIAVTVGHMFPVWLGFRGGKGVATGLGVLLAAAPLAGLAAALVWLAAAAATRISSVGALAASAAAPLLAWAVTGRATALLALIVAALIWWRHAGNIARLRAGTEPRIGARR
jgi:glycerol-3-phosphate acyltransferase PlsY